MRTPAYRYQFDPKVAMEDVEASLVLAILGAESLHGETQVKLAAAHYLDVESHTCVVDVTEQVGQDLNRLFAGYLRREFGAKSFDVARVQGENDLVPTAA
jgi:hypothetical protein